MSIKHVTLLVTSLILLSSCQKNTSWSQTVIQSGFDNHDIKILTYSNQNYIKDLALEIVYSESLDVYINLYSLPIDEKETTITLSTEKQKATLKGLVLKGGQKIKFFDENKEIFINLLQTSDSISLSIDPFYRLQIETKGLKKLLKNISLPISKYRSDNPIGIAF